VLNKSMVAGAGAPNFDTHHLRTAVRACRNPSSGNPKLIVVVT
jgi:hypothetical protein